MSDRPARALRPFWMHQLAEYIVGLVLVAQGLQSPTPALPAIAGGVVMLNAATVRGPLAAFSVVHRRTHRVVDLVVIAGLALAAVQPWISVESTTRLTMGAFAAILFVVWRGSSFAERVAMRDRIGAEGGRSAEVGRIAGRLAGDGVNLARRLKKRSDS